MTTLRIQTLRDALTVPFRHKGKMLLALLLGVGLAAAYALLTPKTYRTESRLLIRLGRESVAVDPTAAGFDRVSVSQSRMAEVHSELQIATSADLIATLVEEMTPAGVTGDADATVASATAQVQRRLSAHVVEDSYSIELAYEDTAADRAQRVLARLVELFLDKHVQVHRTPGAQNFFARELAQIREQLLEKEARLQALRGSAGVVARAAQESGLIQRIGELDQAVATAEIQLAELVAVRGAPEDASTSDASLASVVARLRELRLQEIELLSKYPDESRQVVAVRELIAGAAGMLEKTRAAAEAAATARRDILIARRDSARAELTTLGDSAAEFARLERELETLRGSEATFAASSEQSRIDRALELERISNVSVVQPAFLPLQPVGPKTGLCLAIGMLLGLFGAFATAAVAEVLDDTVRRPEDSDAASGVPTVASIPRLPRPALTPPVLDPTDEIAHQQPSLAEHPASVVPHLAQALALNTGDEGSTALAISSAHAGAGGSSVATMLATDLARRGLGPVLLVDANLQRPGLSRELHCEDEPGLGNALVDDERRAKLRPQRLAAPDLFFLPAGTLCNGSTPVVRGARVERLVMALRQHFRHVVFDLPPAQDGGLGLAIARTANQTLLVAECGRTRGQVLRAARDALAAGGVVPAGLVLNKREFPIPNWLYRKL